VTVNYSATINVHETVGL